MSILMPRKLLAFVCCLLLVSCGGTGSVGKPGKITTASDDEGAIDHLLAAYQRAYNARKASTVADLYAVDARWLAAAGPILEGRPAITAALEQFMAVVPPVLTLTEGDKLMVGEYAVSRGIYAMSGEAGSESRSLGGSYLNVLRKDAGGWRIVGQQMNYNFEISPDMWVGRRDVVEALPENGSLTDLAEALETDYNSGRASLVAAHFTRDAWVSFGGSTSVTGRKAISRTFQEGIDTSSELVIHGVDTLELDGGTAVEVGWYELGAGDGMLQWGTYSLLARKVPEGEWQIDWLVATASAPGR